MSLSSDTQLKHAKTHVAALFPQQWKMAHPIPYAKGNEISFALICSCSVLVTMHSNDLSMSQWTALPHQMRKGMWRTPVFSRVAVHDSKRYSDGVLFGFRLSETIGEVSNSNLLVHAGRLILSSPCTAVWILLHVFPRGRTDGVHKISIQLNCTLLFDGEPFQIWHDFPTSRTKFFGVGGIQQPLIRCYSCRIHHLSSRSTLLVIYIRISFISPLPPPRLLCSVPLPPYPSLISHIRTNHTTARCCEKSTTPRITKRYTHKPKNPQCAS